MGLSSRLWLPRDSVTLPSWLASHHPSEAYQATKPSPRYLAFLNSYQPQTHLPRSVANPLAPEYEFLFRCKPILSHILPCSDKPGMQVDMVGSVAVDILPILASATIFAMIKPASVRWVERAGWGRDVKEQHALGDRATGFVHAIFSSILAVYFLSIPTFALTQDGYAHSMLISSS